MELKLLDKLDTERDKVQSTTQRLRDIEVQQNNNQISDYKALKLQKDTAMKQKQEKNAQPWIDHQNIENEKNKQKDFFLMEQRKARESGNNYKAGSYDKFTDKFSLWNYHNINRKNNLIHKNLSDYHDEQKKIDKL